MPFLWAFGMMVVAYLLMGLIQKPQAQMKPAALDEFDFPRSEEGTPQSVVFGDVWTGDWNVVWYGNMRSKGIKSKTGKKG